MHRLRSRVIGIVAGMLFGVAALLTTTPISAAWNDQELVSATFTAGTVNPPLNLRCTGGGLVTPITFRWDPPVGGVGWDSYSWTSSAPLLGTSNAGTFTAGTTSFTISPSLLSVGTVQFQLRAVKGAWSSVAAVSQFSVTLGLVASC
jgi:predicted ribosomally synthesized peptide with SipW-like signal peptide